ncbi:MAG: thioredoxin family protein [Elusimicrobia bacterium]|nr:thioredoxin family protein [Elusimicrobiota bacterium]
MAFLDADLRGKVRERLLDLAGPVRLVFFKEDGSDACARAESLLREVAALSDKLELEVLHRYLDDKVAADYGIEAAPTLILVGPAGGRVRMLGKLSGYEFAVMMAALKDTASGTAEVGEPAREKLDWVAQPVRIRVFVDPTCVHCPKVARAAQRFAVRYPLVTAEIIDASGFPVLAEQYEVDQVPKTVINDRVLVLGAAPEAALAQAVALSVQGEGPGRPSP